MVKTIFANLKKKDYFKVIVDFLHAEFMKPMKEKFDSVLNKTLLITGDTGVGKSSFMHFTFGPICKFLAMDLAQQYEPATINKADVKVVYQADNDDPNTFYKMSLIPNGDSSIQIKFQDNCQVLKYKTAIILTNWTPAEIKKKAGA